MSVHLFDSSAAQVGAGEKTGYVYVLPGEVESILKQGYLSVREQLNRGLTNENALMVKYGDQFDEAQVQYDDCPSSIVSYLDWRAGDNNDGAKSNLLPYKPVKKWP